MKYIKNESTHDYDCTVLTQLEELKTKILRITERVDISVL